MAVFELFSHRKKKSLTPISDVYQYEKIPNSLRVQIIQIILDTIGPNHYTNTIGNEVYNQIHKILCKEFGVFSLDSTVNSSFEAIYNYLLKSTDVDESLDIIEISFYMISTYVTQNEWRFKSIPNRKQTCSEAIKELNYRFKESGVGFQFNNNQLIQITSEFIHSEVIKPTLLLLSSEEIYRGANDEFLKAHSHYRHKLYKECLNECLKAFESTMKSIHNKLSWPYNNNDTAKTLINNLLTKGLLPNYLQNQLSAMRTLLESGTPTIRNKEAGHGQGSDINTVPEYYAKYMLHLTASNILFLTEAAANYS